MTILYEWKQRMKVSTKMYLLTPRCSSVRESDSMVPSTKRIQLYRVTRVEKLCGLATNMIETTDMTNMVINFMEINLNLCSNNRNFIAVFITEEKRSFYYLKIPDFVSLLVRIRQALLYRAMEFHTLYVYFRVSN